MNRYLFPAFLFAVLLFAACKPSVKPDDLYGKWKYIKFEKPAANPPVDEPDWKLKLEKPYIEFSKNNDLQMWWGGELFSHGKFRTDGNKIVYTETLESGQTREFPFYVTELTDKTLVFETQGDGASKVTAVR